MATVHYTAKVKDSRLLELPEEAQALGLQPGEEISVSVERNNIQAGTAHPPNEKALKALRQIAENQKDRPYSDGSDTQRLLREARSGAMYGYDPSD